MSTEQDSPSLWHVEAKRYVSVEFLVRAYSEDEAKADAEELADEALDDFAQNDMEVNVSSWSGSDGSGLLPIWSGGEDGRWER